MGKCIARLYGVILRQGPSGVSGADRRPRPSNQPIETPLRAPVSVQGAIRSTVQEPASVADFDSLQDDPARWIGVVGALSACYSGAPAVPALEGTVLVALLGRELALKLYHLSCATISRSSARCSVT